MIALMENLRHLTATLLPIVATLFWQLTVVALLGLLLAHLTPPSRSALRARVLRLTVLAMLATPLLSIPIPQVLEASKPRVNPPAPVAMDTPTERISKASLVTPITTPAPWRAPQVVISTRDWITTRLYGWLWLPVGLALGAYLFAGWRLARGWRHARSIRRSACFIDDPIFLSQTEHWMAGLRRTRRPVVLESAEIDRPILIGPLRPAIVLPIGFRSSTDAPALRATIEHELAHHAHGDHWTVFVQRLSELLLAFQPAVWLVSARLSREMEKAADDRAAGFCGTRHGYAAQLLDILEVCRRVSRGGPTRPALHAGLSVCDDIASLQQRLQRLVRAESHRPWRVSRTATVTVACLLLGSAVLGSIDPDAVAAANLGPDTGTEISAGNSSLLPSQLWWEEDDWFMHATVNGASVIDPADPLRFNPEPGGHVVVTMIHVDHPPRTLTLQRSAGNMLDTQWSVDGKDVDLDADARAFIGARMAQLDWKGRIGGFEPRQPD